MRLLLILLFAFSLLCIADIVTAQCPGGVCPLPAVKAPFAKVKAVVTPNRTTVDVKVSAVVKEKAKEPEEVGVYRHQPVRSWIMTLGKQRLHRLRR